MKYITFLLILLALLSSGCSTQTASPLVHKIPSHCKKYYDMKQARCIDEKTFIDTIEPYRVVFFGDHHNKKDLHKKFATLLNKLQERNIYLANEWFTPADNERLELYTSSKTDKDFVHLLNWRRSYGRDYTSYRPIYEAVKKNNGRLFGINMTQGLRKKISRANMNLLTKEQRHFYKTLDLNIYAHQSLLSPFFSSCHTNNFSISEKECIQRMYRVQVAWDTYMAQNSYAIATQHLNSKKDLLIIFAGSMHMLYGLGINTRFARLTNEPFVTVIPVHQNITQAEVGAADFLIFYDNHK